ncbi:MAG: hypothetical protein A2X81_11130 [Desulfobacterales bacterium GWB2_56_26]|nr:MAG: hypothetical protein A2X81_11130 [Desulfobacterales bacterium GWB2_56_26]
MSRRELKKMLLELLQKQDLPEIFQVISEFQEHLLLNPLFIALCHQNERVCFHAVRCFGRIVPAMADKDPEAARVVMRRFLWSLNDESGGIGWGAPEAMAEIMCHSESLRQEYLHMLISYMREDGDELFQDGNFIELPMLQRGVLRGIGRLAQCHRSEMLVRNIAGDVAAYLQSSDQEVVGLAIWCLGMLGTVADSAKILPLVGNEKEISLYIDDVLKKTTVGQLAENALQLIGKRADISH